MFNEHNPSKWGQWTAAPLVLFQMVNIIFMIDGSKCGPSVMCYSAVHFIEKGTFPYLSCDVHMKS